MKKTITFSRLLPIMLMTLLLIGSGVKATGANLLTDDFTGTVGAALTANGWTLHSGTATPFLISSPGLTYTSFLGTGIGNAASTGGTSDDVNKAFASTNSGSLYLAFMYKPTSASTTTDYSVMFGATSGASVTSFYGKLYVQRDASNNLRFGITKQTVGSATYTGYTYSLNTTYLIIIRYDFVAGTANDAVKLFVNPVLGSSEPSATVTGATDAATDPAQLTSIVLRQATTTAAAVYDGFRVGTTWADVATSASISAPTTQASSISFGSVGQTGLTANWSNGDGAKRVVIMNTSNSFTAPTDGTDPTANTVYGGSGEQVVYNGTGTSVAITGLTASTTYHFRVYEYNGSSSTTKYLTTTGTNNPNSQITNAATSPVITTVGTINAFANTVLNSSSAEQSYTLQGSNLTGDVTVTPPAGFEISKTSGSGFVANPSTLTFTSVEITLAQNVYVRFAPTAAQAYSGNITHTSTGATQVDKALSGTGIKAEPTNHATAFTATTNSSTQITVTWTDATGGQIPDGYLVKASATSPTAPADGTAETDATLVKNIAQGTQTAVFTGLSASTTYNFSIWPYTNSGSSINYKTGSEPTASATTLVQPWTEDFEAGTKSGYTAGDVTNTKGSWNISEGLLGTAASDRKNGSQSVRLRYTSASVFGELKMNFDKNGAGTVSVSHALYGSDASGSWKLQMSIDGGLSWLDIGSTVSTTSTTLTTQNFTINQSGNVRFKIVQLSGSRISIDDIVITNCSAPTTSVWTGSTSTDWDLTYNWSNGNPDNTTEVTIPDVTNDPIINSNSIVSSLNLNTGSILSVNAGKHLTVSTTLTNNGTLNLLSDATGTATLLSPATLSGSGTYNVKQYLPTGRNSYISSPVSAATTAALSSASSVVSYNEQTAAWDTESGALTSLKGYISVNNTTSGAITFSGTINNGDLSISPTRHTGVTKEGFNLVGNPYPSYVNWASATKTNLLTTMWYRTRSASAYVFDTYNSTGNIGTALGATTVSSLIPPMQGFWVRVDAGQTSGTLGFTNAMRSHADVSTNSFKAPEVIAQQVLRLQVSNGENKDEAIVLFNDAASNGYDAYDSPKMTNANVAIPEIFTMAGTEQLVINGLNSVTANQELPLGFKTGQSNLFTIKATEISNFEAGMKVILRDNALATEQELTDGSTYSFSSDVATTTTRFSVLFKSAGVTTGLNNTTDKVAFIYKNANNQISVSLKGDLSNEAYVSVYNAVGQKLHTEQITNANAVLGTPFTSGIYLVTVNNGGKSVTKKVILN
jgi:hypothetical protein